MSEGTELATNKINSLATFTAPNGPDTRQRQTLTERNHTTMFPQE